MAQMVEKYKVRSGDNLAAIASKLKTTVPAIQAANKGKVSVSKGEDIYVPKQDNPNIAPDPAKPLVIGDGRGMHLNQPVLGNGQPLFGTPKVSTPNPMLGGLGFFNNSPYNGFQTPTTNGFTTAPRAQYYTPPANGFQTPATNGIASGYSGLTPSQSQVITPSRPNQGLTPSQAQGIAPSQGLTPSQGVTPPSGSSSSGTTSGGTSSSSSGGSSVLKPPSDSITVDNYPQWVQYWNDMAKQGKQGGNSEFPGFWGGGNNGRFYKTLREAKQATAKATGKKFGAAESIPQYQLPVYTDPNAGVGYNVNQGMSWRVG